MATTIRIAEKIGPQLLGRTAGSKNFGDLCKAMSEAAPGAIVLLDFANVEVVTGSWINAALVPLLQWAANEQIDIFPVISNASPDCLDDLRLVADWTRKCFLVSEGRSAPASARLVGKLDPAQRETLLAVLASPGVTGAELERRSAKDGIGATAWNNRLKDLFEKRLLRRERRGREQVYSPIAKEITVDG